MVRKIKKKVRYKLSKMEYYLRGAITSVEVDENILALTFDDGPHPEYTPALLDVLERYQAKATFFVVGERAQRYPNILERMRRNGHDIGNHSWDHASLPRIDSASRRLQIKKCELVLGKNHSNLLRPPFGNQNLWSRIDALIQGYQVVTWSLLADDWLDHSAELIYDKLKKGIRPGTIVLLHDNLIHVVNDRCIDRRPTIQAVNRLLADGIGFKFVTVTEMLKRGKAVYRTWEQLGDLKWMDALTRTD